MPSNTLCFCLTSFLFRSYCSLTSLLELVFIVQMHFLVRLAVSKYWSNISTLLDAKSANDVTYLTMPICCFIDCTKCFFYHGLFDAVCRRIKISSQLNVGIMHVRHAGISCVEFLYRILMRKLEPHVLLKSCWMCLFQNKSRCSRLMQSLLQHFQLRAQFYTVLLLMLSPVMHIWLQVRDTF